VEICEGAGGTNIRRYDFVTRGTDHTCAHTWQRNQRNGLFDICSSTTPSVRPQRGQGSAIGGFDFTSKFVSRSNAVSPEVFEK
jgi:hypothetical protein